MLNLTKVSGKCHGFHRLMWLSPTKQWSNAGLSDSIINELLLKRGNTQVGGLQNVNLGLTNSFEVETGEFVQIIHTGEGHWHVVSTIGTQHPDVNVFDSMYCHCPEHSKVQISNLLMKQFDFTTTMFKCSQVGQTVAFLPLLLWLHFGMGYILGHFISIRVWCGHIYSIVLRGKKWKFFQL